MFAITTDTSNCLRHLVAAATVMAASLLGGCYAKQVGHIMGPAALENPPEVIATIFSNKPNRMLVIDAIDGGTAYRFDPSEKDRQFAREDNSLRFNRVEISLCDRMPSGMVLVNITFVDGQGTRITAMSVDLIRLTPMLDLDGDMQYPEMLLEEYERFGVSFRREHDEFVIWLAEDADHSARDAAFRAYRLGIWNNCLDPTKWEMVLTSEDYSDFRQRLRGNLYINQQRTLAHNWFYLDADLYRALVQIKNPHLAIDPSLDYEELSRRAEQVIPDIDQLRTIKARMPTNTVEIGHQSGRKITALNTEQYYKWQHGLAINREEFTTYDQVLNQPVVLASFTDRGFYQPEDPKEFDFSWLRQLDHISVDTLEVPGSDCYVQITLQGVDAPYTVIIGNIDMAMLDEQALLGMPFGFNPYPKTRRHNPPQDTIHYETERMPKNIKPYIMLLDSRTGHWVNNQKKGLEKIYLGWESINREVLVIYLVTYERILPVWVARVKIDDGTVDRVRIRRRLYDY